MAKNGEGDTVFLATTTPGLYARVFDQGGTPRGGPIFVAELNEGGLVFGDAAVADDGSFAVAYAGNGGLKSLGRCFDADGRALGDEFVVSNRGAASSVAPTPGGGFVAALAGPSSTPVPEGTDVYARRMAAVPRPDGLDRVYVRGTGWTNDYLSLLDSDRVGSSRFGYVAGGTPDPLPLPFVNLNQVSLGFTRDVDVKRDDLRVSGVRHASYAFSDFDYDDERHVATWTFADNLPTDRLTLTLDAPGLQHVLPLNVVPGDADRSGRTNSVDLATVRRRQGSSPRSTIGYSAYLRIMDLNGDGRINAIDLASVRRGLNDSLPPATALPATSLLR